MDKKYSFTPIYVILAIFAIVLILTGIFLPSIFDFLNVQMTKTPLVIFQSAFILSGLCDFALLIYAVKKLK